MKQFQNVSLNVFLVFSRPFLLAIHARIDASSITIARYSSNTRTAICKIPICKVPFNALIRIRFFYCTTIPRGWKHILCMQI